MNGQIIQGGTMWLTRLAEDGQPTGEPSITFEFSSAQISITPLDDDLFEPGDAMPVLPPRPLGRIIEMKPMPFRLPRGRARRNLLRLFWTPTQLARMTRRARQKTHRVRRRR